VELDKTQVVAEAEVGQGSVKALREMQIYKKHKIFHQYVCFCSNNVDLKNNNREYRTQF